MPRNGSYIIGGLANRGGTARDLLAQLGISQQATSELVDTLVVRGYLERRPDPGVPGRQALDVTDRGRAAAEAIRDGVEAVDVELAEILTPAELGGLCAGLVALTDIRERSEQSR